ncbi:hypothetical protein LJ655_02395 [Paraburkholderia sp. MMS20-SJTN17]|uniref:Outer membrane lipoprotein-sorting protein n=1 Tax=Paraburkholderia translucens TaxID=2886945 RepID=A0ABS8K7P8_9BURK|nr:hypothetical protein [Paraburkholderia sp. MMS20-SJTN17]MCC8400755.1 hypothetical protein [Paraburkholderia sp. MMS20-SJTN17]
MKRIRPWLLAGCASALAVAWMQMPAAEQTLTVDEIVARNAAARGGDDAWRKVQAMMWAGHIDSANAPTPSVPFVLALKRPSSTRFEMTAMNQRVLRMFDGKEGWKIRPSSGGMPDVQAYSPAEVRYASEEQVIDGPLLDHAAKGIAVSLDGNDVIDDRKAYRLLVTLPSGAHRHVWVDAQSFLDVKYDREAPSLTGKPVTVEVSYRDFRDVDGLKLPYTIESGVVGMPKKDKLVIDRVSINPPFNDGMFVKPAIAGRRGSVTVGVEGAPPPRSAFRQMP